MMIINFVSPFPRSLSFIFLNAHGSKLKIVAKELLAAATINYWDESSHTCRRRVGPGPWAARCSPCPRETHRTAGQSSREDRWHLRWWCPPPLCKWAPCWWNTPSLALQGRKQGISVIMSSAMEQLWMKMMTLLLAPSHRISQDRFAHTIPC